jgi:hypothetical protein
MERSATSMCMPGGTTRSGPGGQLAKPRDGGHSSQRLRPAEMLALPSEALSCNVPGLLPPAWRSFASPKTYQHAIHIVARGRGSTQRFHKSAISKPQAGARRIHVSTGLYEANQSMAKALAGNDLVRFPSSSMGSTAAFLGG